MSIFSNFLKKSINKDWNQMVDDKISSFTEDKIGDNGHAHLHVEYSELEEFKFLEFSIVGRFKIKTLKGAFINFEGDTENFKAESDIQEIESEYSESSNQGITLIDMEVTKEIIQFLESETIKTISFLIDNKNHIFIISEPFIISEKIKLFSQT